MADMMESCVVNQPTKRRLRRQPQGARPTRRGQTHDTEIATNKGAAGGSLSPGACQLYVRPHGGRGGTAGSADPTRVGAGLIPAPIRAGRKPRRTNHLRERRTRGPKPARHRPFARFFAGNLHLQCRASGSTSVRPRPFSSLQGRRPSLRSNHCAAGRAQAATTSSATLSMYGQFRRIGPKNIFPP